VSRRACSGRAVLHLDLISLRVGDELLEIVDRQVLARDEHDRDLGDERDRGEICCCIVLNIEAHWYMGRYVLPGNLEKVILKPKQQDSPDEVGRSPWQGARGDT
jgi:hypothetical protein